MTHVSQQLEQAAHLWQSARLPIALTGAGISVSSGIPDFRGPKGLWQRHDPAQVATIQALRTNPRRVWEFLIEAIDLLGTARPNPAHLALARLEQAGMLHAIITQNIDSLHQQAGSQEVIEFHGSAARFYCTDCHKDIPAPAPASLTPADLPLRCSHCTGVVRPDFVFFGELIPHEAMLRTKEIAREADLCVIIGTSGEVAPASSIPYQIQNRGGKVLEINLGETCYGDMADIRMDQPAEQVLPALADILAPS